jgi:hypothetical protein
MYFGGVCVQVPPGFADEIVHPPKIHPSANQSDAMVTGDPSTSSHESAFSSVARAVANPFGSSSSAMLSTSMYSMGTGQVGASGTDDTDAMGTDDASAAAEADAAAERIQLQQYTSFMGSGAGSGAGDVSGQADQSDPVVHVGATGSVFDQFIEDGDDDL